MSNYTHDCDGCTFLGTDQRGGDWYVCGKPKMRSIIRRFGNEGCEYESGLIAGCVEMTRLEILSARMGFEFNDHEMIRYAKIYVGKQKEYKSAADGRDNGPDFEDENLLRMVSGGKG